MRMWIVGDIRNDTGLESKDQSKKACEQRSSKTDGPLPRCRTFGGEHDAPHSRRSFLRYRYLLNGPGE